MPDPVRFEARVAVYLVLSDLNGQVLFQLRQNTGYCDGLFGLPSGHVERGEPLLMALSREAKEEIGIDLLSVRGFLAKEPDLVLYRSFPDRSYVDFFFRISLPEIGKAVLENREPNKCAELSWLNPDSAGVIQYVSEVIRKIGRGIRFMERRYSHA